MVSKKISKIKIYSLYNSQNQIQLFYQLHCTVFYGKSGSLTVKQCIVSFLKSTVLLFLSKGIMIVVRSGLQKQPSRGVLRKRCSENKQQIYRKTFQINFIEIAIPHGCFPVHLLHSSRTPVYKNTQGELLLTITL